MIILSSLANLDRMDLIPFLNIFLFIFFFISWGLAANVTPPDLQIGPRVVPALALPVPFCLQGFFPPPLTSDLFFLSFSAAVII